MDWSLQSKILWTLQREVVSQNNSFILYFCYTFCRDGEKMSKRKKNYPDPMSVINKYGSDALRCVF